MTSYNELVYAVDVAIRVLGVNKLCQSKEDDKAYYLIGCGDNGEPLYAVCMCRVEKGTLKSELVPHTSKYFDSPKKDIPFPKERLRYYTEPKWTL